jgi:hypothetical protein
MDVSSELIHSAVRFSDASQQIGVRVATLSRRGGIRAADVRALKRGEFT